MNRPKFELPTDKNGIIMQINPRATALARTVDASISTTTKIDLNSDTRLVRVYAIAKDVYLRWGSDGVDATNFDEVIPAGEVMDFGVPTRGDGQLHEAICVIERESGATVIVIEK